MEGVQCLSSPPIRAFVHSFVRSFVWRPARLVGDSVTLRCRSKLLLHPLVLAFVAALLVTLALTVWVTLQRAGSQRSASFSSGFVGRDAPASEL